MALGAAYEDDAITALANSPTQPKPALEKASLWRTLPEAIGRTATALGMGVAEKVAQGAASAAEVIGGFGQVAGAYPELMGPGVALSPDQRRQADVQRRQLLAGGVDMSNEVGDALRAAGKTLRPDPTTASAAEQIVYGFGRGAAAVVGGAVAMGPFGVAAAGLEEANTQADELRLQGVDLATRTKAGLVQGAGLALAALPVVGTTLKATAGLYALGGPGGFMAQQALTREILRGAGYDKIGAQFDPFDPVGLTVSALLPAGFAAWGLHGQRIQRAVNSLPDLPPRADAAPPAADAAPPAPFPSRPSAVADAVRAYPTEAVDAARVVLLAERRAAANPGAADNLRAMDQHEAALSKAEDQIAAGEPVQVADVAPAPRVPTVETPEFRAWFDGSRAVTPDGAPMVLYHGTGADITQFQVSDRGEFGGGIYLTPDTGGASDYATYRGQGPANVMPVYVSIKNPAGAAEASQVASWKGEENARAELIRRGYDGVIDLRSGQVVAFHPEQIKSAIGNSGAFDPATGSLTDSPYATWADQITAAIREMQARTDAPAPAQAVDAAPVMAPPADARPTVTNKGGDVFIDTRGQGERLHGTGKSIDSLSNDYALTGDSRNIYGQGFYTTDAADIAAGYMKKGGKSAALYRVEVQPGAKLYDMEQPMSPEVAQIARDNMGDNFPTENGETGKPLTTLREVYDEYRAESRNNGLSRDEVQEVFDGIRYKLEADGYTGFQHIGGAATGNRAHTVQIFWMPERDVSITPISLDQFKPDAPTTTQAANPEAAAPARGAGEPPAAAGAADAGRGAGVEAAGLKDAAAPVEAPSGRAAGAPVAAAPDGLKPGEVDPFVTATPIVPRPVDQLPPPAEVASALRSMAGAAGWARQGGKIMRDSPDITPGMDHAEARWIHQSGDVVGRTTWIPAEEWFGRMRTELGKGGLASREDIISAVEKAIAGDKLKAAERRTVDWLRQELDAMEQATERARYIPDDPRELAGYGIDEGLSRADGADLALTAKAAEIDPDAVERAAIQHGDDDAAFMAAVKEIVDAAEAKDTGAGVGSRSPEVRQSQEAGTGASQAVEPGTTAQIDALLSRGQSAPDAIAMRIEAAQAKFPDLMVQMDGMDAPMPMAEFLAAAKAEADELQADAPLMEVAANCALLNGAG